jgi:transposase
LTVGDGNKLDQNAFPEMIREFRDQWQGEQPEVYVMDAAFYNEENLKEFPESLKWISRVPLTIRSDQELTQTLLPEQFTKSTVDERYSFCTVCSEYAGIKQRWMIVESEERRDGDLKTLSKRIEQSLNAKQKSLKSLESKNLRVRQMR